MPDQRRSGLAGAQSLELVWLARLQGSTVGLVRSRGTDTLRNSELAETEEAQEELCALALTILQTLRPATLAQANMPSSSG